MPPHRVAPRFVWYVDDDAQTSQDIIRYWEKLEAASPETRPLRFRHFSTARAAWEALLAGSEPPHAVVVDGHLDFDEGEFAEGAHFIRRVRSSHISDQPLLLAFSGDEYALEEMGRSGADAGFAKGRFKPVFEYLAARRGDRQEKPRALSVPYRPDGSTRSA